MISHKNYHDVEKKISHVNLRFSMRISYIFSYYFSYELHERENIVWDSNEFTCNIIENSCEFHMSCMWVSYPFIDRDKSNVAIEKILGPESFPSVRSLESGGPYLDVAAGKERERLKQDVGCKLIVFKNSREERKLQRGVWWWRGTVPARTVLRDGTVLHCAALLVLPELEIELNSIYSGGI